MVCAICGRMPLMMQSAPISRAADDRLQQMLRRQRVDRRHAGDVDDGDFGAVVDDVLQQVLHHDLGALAVERADDRNGEHPIPQFHHRCRQFGNFTLLPQDDVFAALLEGFET